MPYPCSPYQITKGLVYFARMLDKIRLHAAGQLPPDYHEFLGDGFDGRCLRFLGVSYDAVKDQVAAGGSDEQILDWCRAHGRLLTDEDAEVWSDFMRKRGWRDDASERVAFRLKEAGLEHLDAKVATMFDFLDYDEGRTPPDFSQWEPPRLAPGTATS
jgi:gluconokinase